MLPRSHPHQPTRRRSAVGPPQLCAIAAVLLLLLSLFVLHSRLSSSPLSPPSLPTTTQHDSKPEPESRRASSTPNLSLDLIDDLDIVESDPDSTEQSKSKAALVWDHILGVARLPFGSRTTDPDSDSDSLSDSDLYFASAYNSDADSSSNRVRIVFSSDDSPIDEDIRSMLTSITKIEDALLIKPHKGESPIREGWANWLEGKGDFLRRNRMLQSNLDLLNPKNHPLLQDPDVPGLTGLTRGDRLVQRVLLREMESIPFVGNRKRELHEEEKEKKNKKEEERKAVKRNGVRRWGYFQGIDPYLSFTEFMQKFFGEENKCEIRVFMVWNSPQWTYGVRHQRSLESLLMHHNHACVVVFSETMELEFFKDFVKDGYKVAVAVPNLDELLEGTPTHVFASIWFDWRKTKYYPLHYSELIRLAALYKYGGIYLDSDVIVLKSLSSVQNSIGMLGQIEGNSTFSGAVMAFEKNSDFVMECLKEFYSTYDDSHLRWNGADLLTRVINKIKNNNQLHVKILPSFQFYPISSSNITSYFAEPSDEADMVEQDILFKRIMEESIAFHLWNGITSSLVPEPKSFVERILNHFCLRCLDVI
ncbi:Glycosyltransferase sugar-binding region containing DXD motif [Carex littledalei]|uniref:Glycosyltransferase sugar-binding region containing DXD motif n=1 Tax=Carex littledalei TaxID=544730 RepID=A0A833VVR3_9POAL|nr:Glycosyltransferase sugar-binding region containing DXD motif [Carex littledalei]